MYSSLNRLGHCLIYEVLESNWMAKNLSKERDRMQLRGVVGAICTKGSFLWSFEGSGNDLGFKGENDGCESSLPL